MTDDTMATEFYLFISNDGQLYRMKTQPIIRNLAIKKVKGVYDATLALKLWGHLVEDGIKKYKKEWPGYYRIDAGTKLACAKKLANEYREELDHLVTKMKTLKKAGKLWQKV